MPKNISDYQQNNNLLLQSESIILKSNNTSDRLVPYLFSLIYTKPPPDLHSVIYKNYLSASRSGFSESAVRKPEAGLAPSSFVNSCLVHSSLVHKRLAESNAILNQAGGRAALRAEWRTSGKRPFALAHSEVNANYSPWYPPGFRYNNNNNDNIHNRNINKNNNNNNLSAARSGV